LEVIRFEVLAPHADQKAVEHRSKVVVVWNFVGGPEKRDQRDIFGEAARDKTALVEDGEQRVQDRAVGFEDLVQKDDLGLWQHALGPPTVNPFRERGGVQRAKEFVGLGKAGQQVLEILGVDKPRKQTDEGRLGGARRADEHHMLAGDHRDEEQTDDLLLV